MSRFSYTNKNDGQRLTKTHIQYNKGEAKKTYLPTISTGAYSMLVSASKQTSAQLRSFDEQINHSADYSKSSDYT